MARPMPQCERCNLRSYQTIENEYAELCAKYSELEKLHFILLRAMITIAEGYEIVNGAPFMNGTFERHPKLIGGARMKEIANEALEALKK